MAIKTPEQYLEGLKKQKPKVFLGGKRVESILDHPNTRVTINAIAQTYAMAVNPKFADIFTATSHLTSEKISRWNHVPQNIEDLEKRREMNILMSQHIGTCNVRCVGNEVLHVVAAVTYTLDRKHGTEYHKRFNQFLKSVQEKDWTCNGPMTDAKGDRSKRPSEQTDPDVYLHLVEKRSDGIVVRGAKMHQEGSFACHYHLVVPPLWALKTGEENYAISFAVPSDAEGLVHITQDSPFECERRCVEDLNDLGNPIYGSSTNNLLVFDNVFVPWEGVFLCGEIDGSRDILLKFAKIHNNLCRGSCKVGYMDLIIGAAKAIAELNGVDKTSHVIDKITEMMFIRETTNACAIAGMKLATEDPPGSGIYFPDYKTGIITAMNTQMRMPELGLLAGDLAGGSVVTMPSLAELRNPETQRYVEKYLKGAMGSAEERMRILKFLQHWVAGLQVMKMWHGGGPIQSHRAALGRQTWPDLEEKKRLAKELIGIKG